VANIAIADMFLKDSLTFRMCAPVSSSDSSESIYRCKVRNGIVSEGYDRREISRKSIVVLANCDLIDRVRIVYHLSFARMVKEVMQRLRSTSTNRRGAAC
jgi:hypothetical protein